MPPSMASTVPTLPADNGSMRTLTLIALVGAALVQPTVAQAAPSGASASAQSSMNSVLHRDWYPWAGQANPTPIITEAVSGTATIKNRDAYARTISAQWSIDVCLDNGVQPPADCTWSHLYTGVVTTRVPAARWVWSCTSNGCIRVYKFGTRNASFQIDPNIPETTYGGRRGCGRGKCWALYGAQVTTTTTVTRAER